MPFKQKAPFGASCLGWKTGLEPATFGITIRRSNQLSYIHHFRRTLVVTGRKYNRRRGTTLLCAGMHVLVLPKWYPARPDPQRGDFIRKQMLAVAGAHKMSVIYPCPVNDLATRYELEVDDRHGLWELRCHYRSCTIPNMPLRKLVNFIRWREALQAGVRHLLAERGLPDLIHAHILTRAVLGAFTLARKWHVPYIISEQSSVYLDGTWQRKNFIAKAIDRRLFRHAARTTAVSAHLAAALVRARLCTNADVVPNMIPGMERPLPPAGPANSFMMVADLVDHTKNISGALRALAAAHAQGHPLRLDVIGDGPDREPLHALARTLNISSHVRWHGRLAQADVLPAMAATGTVIINSNVETFSVVTGEALASGKPVIATRCGGPEQFITAANGVLIPVADDAALAAAMAAMASGHQRYSPATVRESIRGRFDAKAVADGFNTVYQRVLSHA